MRPAQADWLADAAPAVALSAWPPADWHVADGWRPVVEAFGGSTEGRRLAQYLHARLAAGAVIYPPQPLRALELTAPESIHAVILGQDPYHGTGQAEGLAFSVAPGVRLPPSLRNIFSEWGVQPETGSLAALARQGVLLLNTCLTVEAGQPASHAGKGWEALTDALIDHVARVASPCVFMLWGAHAQSRAGLIEAAAGASGSQTLVLKANHPSPLSARRPPVPFIGCGHFRAASLWLAARGQPGFFAKAQPGP